MTITLNLSPDMEQVLQKKVAESGQSVEAYLLGLLETHFDSDQQFPLENAPLPEQLVDTELAEIEVPPPPGTTLFTTSTTFPLENLPRLETDVTIDPHWLEDDDE